MIFANVKPEKLIKFSPATKNRKLIAKGIFYGYKWTCEKESDNETYYEFVYLVEGNEWHSIKRIDDLETVDSFAYRGIKSILHAKHEHYY